MSYGHQKFENNCFIEPNIQIDYNHIIFEVNFHYIGSFLFCITNEWEPG
jgi:hypothetical protein